MQRFTIPMPPPPCHGILPVFKNRFSGWHLGMGQPDNISAILGGLVSLISEHPRVAPVAVGMALWGTQAYPLARGMARWGKLLSGVQGMPSRLLALLDALDSRPQLDESDDEAMGAWHELVRQEDRSLLLRFLAVTLADPTKGIAWLGHIWQDLLFLNQPELSRNALDMVKWDGITRPLRDRMYAEWAMQTQPPEQALAAVEQLDADTWGLWRGYAGAELLLRKGDLGQGREVLAEVWKHMPWHVNLTLKTHDLFHPVEPAPSDEFGSTAILAYSWNKADLLNATLRSVAKSHIGPAKVYALDNGSDDHTATVLRTMRDTMGCDRFHIETLPINVGAPAARNWLLSLPHVRAAPWVAYLDDDIELPNDWLQKLHGAAKVNPGIGAVGCRITAATPPYGLQSADYNLFPTPPAPMEPGKLPNRVLLFDNCAGSLDNGMFTYTRPCLSVSGCCHMLSRQALDAAGDFDLRYTPSQFDDLDRDLRSALAGFPAVYTGALQVRHVQHSSLAKSQTPRQIGHVMGNKFKLDTKYSDEELTRLGRDNKDLLWADLEAKHALLLDRLT